MVDVINNSKLTWPRGWPSVCRALSLRAKKVLALKKMDVAVIMVEPEEIKKLNKRYRRHNKVTDVLSFTYELTTGYLHGEIIICLKQAEVQSRRRQHSLQKELNTLVTHGLIHLGGYDHKTKRERVAMQFLEKKVLI